MAKRTKKLIENEQADEIRINKYLSDAGICSRRDADKYIAAGEVTVDGVTAVMGTKVKKGQSVTLQGKKVNLDEALVLIAFNKPRGIVCTTDKREKDNIINFINYGKRIYPIGRLDKDSEGLILLTNDGNIVNKILRAGNNHEKEYVVTVNKPLTADFIKGMSEGVPILDTVTLPCIIKAMDKYTFKIILTQGLNRQIRRMCEYYGYKVLTLKRTRIMNINLGHLQLGGYRNVTEKEIALLNELISNSVNTSDTMWNSMEDAAEEPKQAPKARTVWQRSHADREKSKKKYGKSEKINSEKINSEKIKTRQGKSTDKISLCKKTGKSTDKNKPLKNRYQSESKKLTKQKENKSEETSSKSNHYERKQDKSFIYSGSKSKRSDKKY